MCDFWYEVIVLICSFGFHQTKRYASRAKHLHFGLVCSKDSVLEDLWFVHMQDQQTAKTFIEVLTLVDDQLIKGI